MTGFYDVKLLMRDGSQRLESVLARDYCTAERRAVELVGAARVWQVVGARKTSIGSLDA